MTVKVTKDGLLRELRESVNLMQLSKLIDNLAEFVVEKNNKYGDAWQLYALLTPLIRIREKLVRLENVSNNLNGSKELTVVTCSDVYAELTDIVGYAILAMLWIEESEYAKKVREAVDGIKTIPWRLDPEPDPTVYVNKEPVDARFEEWPQPDE